MLHSAQRLSPDLGPIDSSFQLVVNEPADSDVIATDQIQPMFDLLGRVVWACRRGGEDALDRLREDEVGGLIVAEKLTG